MSQQHPTTHPLSSTGAISLVLLCLLVVTQAASATEKTGEASPSNVYIIDAAQQVATVKYAHGDSDGAHKVALQAISELPATTASTTEAWRMSLLLMRVGLDSAAHPYLRRVIDNAPESVEMPASATADSYPEQRAAALYALGQPAAADETLSVCSRGSLGSDHCKPWLIAEVAAAKEDWQETATLLDAHLGNGFEAPIRALRLRLDAAHAMKDEQAVGIWRSKLVQRDQRVAPREANTMARDGEDSIAPAPRLTAYLYLIIGLTLALVIAMWWAQRINR